MNFSALGELLNYHFFQINDFREVIIEVEQSSSSDDKASGISFCASLRFLYQFNF